MADLFNKLRYGLASELNAVSVENGTIRVTADTQKLYVDLAGSRMCLGDVVLGMTASQITGQNANAILPKIYVASDTFKLYFYDSTGSAWKIVGADITDLVNAIGTYDSTVITNKGTIADRLDEIQAQIGSTYPASTDNDFVDIATRISGAESDIDEVQAQLGNYAASTAQGFTSVEDRFTSDEADITEIKAQIGATYPASTASGFKSIDTRLTELADAVGNINKFDIKVVQQLPASHEGESFVIYFVPIAPGADDNGGKTKYVEYMWFKTGQKKTIDDPDNPGQTIEVDDGYYEEIGITEADLTEYYKSSEVDAIIGTDDVTAGTLRYRIKTNEDDITELKAKFGAYAASTATGFTSVEARFTADETAISGAESDIDELQAQLGTYAASTDNDFVSIEDRFAELEAKFGAYLASDDNDFVTVENRFTADEAEIAEINAKLGNMLDSTAQGFASVEDRLSAIEGGAVTQSAGTADAEKPVLVSANNDHDAIEYVSSVTVNADAGSVTANSIVLGGATLTFNSTTGALEVNF